MKRLSCHPTLQKNVLFKYFQQEVKITDQLQSRISFERIMQPLASWMNSLANRLLVIYVLSLLSNFRTMLETDLWFKTRSLLLQEQKSHVINLQSNLKKIVKEKLSLTSATNIFHDNLSQFLGSNVLQEDSSISGGIFKQQAEADEELIFLAKDYENMIDDVIKVLEIRKSAVRRLNKMKIMVEAGKGNQEELERAANKFDSLNQNMRRELEHFENVMMDEFNKAFNIYNKKYDKAMLRNKAKF